MKHFPALVKAFVTGCLLSFLTDAAYSQQTYIDGNCPGNGLGFEVQVFEPHCKLNNGAIEVNLVTNPLVQNITYQWSTGATMVGRAGVQISDLSPGMYGVTGTDYRGCSVEYAIEVKDDTANLGFANQAVNPYCTSNSGYIEISLIYTGGLAPFSFQWSNGQTGWQDNNLGPGTYSVVITDSAGCHGYGTWHLTPYYETLGFDYVDVHDDFCHKNNGYISIGMVLGGHGYYSFEWSNGQTGWEDTALAPGTYYVTATDLYGCIGIDSFKILESSDTIPVWVTTTPTGCTPQGTATASYSSFYTVASFMWSNGSTNSYITGLTAGTYTFTVTDVEGCDATASGTVYTSTTSAILPGVSVFPASCMGGGLARSDPSGGVSPYTFLWNTGSTSSQLASLVGGVYSVHITDQLGCTADTSFTLPDTTSTLAVSVETHNAHCIPDGWAVAHATGGTGPYTFAWSNGQAGDTSTNMYAGSYSVTVTDARGCEAYSYFVVMAYTTDAVLPGLSIVKRPLCGRATGILRSTPSGGTEPYQFSWNNGGGGDGLTSTLQNIAAGTYKLTVTDANGCSASASVTASDSTENISPVMVVNSIVCKNEGLIMCDPVGGESPYSFRWSGGSQITFLASSSDDYVSVTGTYSVTVTDDNGCTASASAYVIETDSAIYINGSTKPDTCNAGVGTATIAATGGFLQYDYEWSNGRTSPSLIGLNAGDYSVTVTDLNGCSAVADVIVTNVRVQLTVSITSANALCDKDTGWASATGGGGTPPYRYYWSNGATTATIRGLAPGVYTVVVYDKNGCAGKGIATILDNTANIAPGITTVSAGCNLDNGSAVSAPAGGTAPYTFAWSTGDATPAITNLAGGVYDLTVTDDNGCTAEGRAWVGTSNTTDSVSIKKPDCGASNGSARVYASGGALPYTYAWSTGGVHDSINNIAAGRYVVVITDNNGCKIKDTITVAASSDSLTASVSVSNATCTARNGVAVVTARGGAFPLQYQWSNNSTVPYIDSLGAGIYKVTVTDANHCTVTAAANVQVAGNATAIGLTATQPVCTMHNGSINAVTGGPGTPPYTYKWSNNDSTAFAGNLAAGQYKVTVTDAAGCSASASVTLNSIVGAITINATTTGTVCNNHSGSINALATGGATPYLYAWSNSVTTGSLTGLNAGNYTLTITDRNGCSVTATYTVANYPEPLATGMWTSHYPVCNDSSGQISVLPFNGTAPYIYTWSNGATTNAITNLPSGIYSVTIVDAIGCSVTQADTLPQNSSGGLFASAVTSPSPCGQAGGTAIAWIVGGNPPYTYAWGTTPAQSADTATGLAAGNYHLTVTDTKGCSVSGTFAVSNTGAPMLTMSSTPVTGTGNNGTATVTAGGTGNYTYMWSNGATTAAITNLAVGTYYVTVTTGTGCEAVGSILVSSTIAVNTLADNIGLSLFPNPSTGTVFIKLELPQTGNVTIEWFNALGEKLIAEQLTGIYNLNKPYDLTPYAPGLYIIRVNNGVKTVSRMVEVVR